MHKRLVLLLALLAGGCGAAAHAAAAGADSAGANPCAQTAADNHLVADATQTGVISLRFWNADGARVTFYECVGGRPARLGSARVAPIRAPIRRPTCATPRRGRATARAAFAAVAILPNGQSHRLLQRAHAVLRARFGLTRRAA